MSIFRWEFWPENYTDGGSGISFLKIVPAFRIEAWPIYTLGVQANKVWMTDGKSALTYIKGPNHLLFFEAKYKYSAFSWSFFKWKNSSK